jgi:FeS assembly SUF system protein
MDEKKPADAAHADAPTPGSGAPPEPAAKAEGADAPAKLEARVIEVLRTVFDPEIPVNIYELGLVYAVEADEQTGKVHVRMTLTSPACPVAGTLPGEVETRIKELDAVEDCEVELVWDPPWSKELLSEEAKLQLGLV